MLMYFELGLPMEIREVAKEVPSNLMESPTSRTHFSFPELLNFAVDPENTRKRIADCRTNQQET